MSQPEPEKPAPSKTIQFCALGFVVVGIVIWQFVGPTVFPTPPGGGMNWSHVLGAAVVGGVSALIGAGLGALIDKLRK